jgi:diacylglycerol kinase family enzyme
VAHDVERLTVLASEPLPVQIDGDYVGLRDKLEFRSFPGAVRVVGAPPA